MTRLLANRPTATRTLAAQRPARLTAGQPSVIALLLACVALCACMLLSPSRALADEPPAAQPPPAQPRPEPLSLITAGDAPATERTSLVLVLGDLPLDAFNQPGKTAPATLRLTLHQPLSPDALRLSGPGAPTLRIAPVLPGEASDAPPADQPGPADAPVQLSADRTLQLRLHLFPATSADAGTTTPIATLVVQASVGEQPGRFMPDPEPSIPPWRSDKSKPSGFPVTGTWQLIPVSSAADAPSPAAPAAPAVHSASLHARSSLTHPLTVGRLGPVNACEIDPVPSDDGSPPQAISLRAHLAPGRVWAGEGAWAVKILPEPVALDDLDALLLTITRLETDHRQPHLPASPPIPLAVALRAAGGTWSMALTPSVTRIGRQTIRIPADALRRGGPGVGSGPDAVGFADLRAVDAVAVGIPNPFGVGTVHYHLHELSALRLAPDEHRKRLEQPIRAVLDTSTIHAINNVGHVPPGLFGFHQAGSPRQSQGPDYWQREPVNASPETFLRLTRPGFIRPLQHTGMQGRVDAATAREHLAQRDREAAEGKPVNASYDTALATAGDALHGVMQCITDQNLWARPKWMDAPDLDAYTEGVAGLLREWAARAATPQQPHNTLRMIEFWNEPFMWGRHINRPDVGLSAGPADPGGNRGRTAWTDPTQFSYIPANLGAQMYSRFFNAGADALREVNPFITIGGPSSMNLGSDHFEHFRRYVAPILLQTRDRIDFITEHHYQGEPDSYAAEFIAVNTWARINLGRALPIINTEANDLADIAPDDRRPPEAARALVSLARAYYNTADILACILHARDITPGRALHALWNAGWTQTNGEFLAYSLMAPLRGQTLRTRSDDPRQPLLAAVRTADQTVVVLLVNDRPHARPLLIDLPQQTAPTRAEATLLHLNPGQTDVELRPHPVRILTDDEQTPRLETDPIPPRGMLRITLHGMPEPRRILHSITLPIAGLDTAKHPVHTYSPTLRLGPNKTVQLPADTEIRGLRAVCQNTIAGVHFLKLRTRSGHVHDLPLPTTGSAFTPVRIYFNPELAETLERDLNPGTVNPSIQLSPPDGPHQAPTVVSLELLLAQFIPIEQAGDHPELLLEPRSVHETTRAHRAPLPLKP